MPGTGGFMGSNSSAGSLGWGSEAASGATGGSTNGVIDTFLLYGQKVVDLFSSAVKVWKDLTGNPMAKGADGKWYYASGAPVPDSQIPPGAGTTMIAGIPILYLGIGGLVLLLAMKK